MFSLVDEGVVQQEEGEEGADEDCSAYLQSRISFVPKHPHSKQMLMCLYIFCAIFFSFYVKAGKKIPFFLCLSFAYILFVFLHFLLSICVIQLLFGVTNSYLALSSAARLWNHIQIQIRSLANCKYEIFQIQIQNAKFGAEVQDQTIFLYLREVWTTRLIFYNWRCGNSVDFWEKVFPSKSNFDQFCTMQNF